MAIVLHKRELFVHAFKKTNGKVNVIFLRNKICFTNFLWGYIKLAISSQSSDSLYLAVCSYTLGCINLLPIPGFDGVSLHDMFPHQLKIGFGTVLCGLAANWAVLAVGYALCFLPWWVSFLIVLVLTVMAALLLPSRHSVCWARMLSTFCLLPVMIKSLGFELLAVSLPTAILNIGFCLLLSYLTAPVLLELIFVSYLYQK